MPLNYNFLKYKDVYSLENTGLVELTYTINRKECDSSTIVKQDKIKVGYIAILPIKLIDGVYSIEVSDGVSTETLPDILFYNNLLISSIDGVEINLCGCKGCNSCSECTECQSLLKTITTLLAFAFVNNPKYSAYINTIADLLKCNIDMSVLCFITNEQILDKEDSKELLLQIIAIFYLTFYLFDLAQATDSEEIVYIKEKYISSKILKCIKKLGFNVQETIELLINNSNVYYWQLDNPVSDIADVIPLINQTYLDTKPYLALDSFVDGETIDYTDIGRIVFCINNTDSLNFEIYDSLNNNVTSSFDIDYDATNRTVLFVSKLSYSFSSLYFKFKNNLTNE